MQNVILVVHLLLALSLVGIVLMQRSEGGGLGMGGGGGGGVMSSRGATTALAKITWALAIAFICTSITLTILAARDSAGSSVIDRLGTAPAADSSAPAGLGGDDLDGLLPPPTGDATTPLIPRAD